MEAAIAATNETVGELAQQHSLTRLELLEPKHHRLVAERDGTKWSRRE
ncbi:MAG: hypothetical protein HOQ07_01680 [Sinomonas sp.]|nr:hypothetical protein [Sinomonas sp.]